MANPIVDLMENGSSRQNSPTPVIDSIRYSQNPGAMIQYLAQSNPVVANAMNLVQQYGGNPQKAFYEEAKRRGIDPNQVLSKLR